MIKKDYGELVELASNQSCHGLQEKKYEVYRDGVLISMLDSFPFCGDNIAMAEFGEEIRFYYVFHPEKSVNFLSLLDHMNLDPAEIDAIAWGYNEAVLSQTHAPNVLFKEASHLIHPDVYNHPLFFRVKGHLSRSAVRDLGQWFGVDNPYSLNKGHRDPCHPCMPGPPDDAVNLLLLALMLDVPAKLDFPNTKGNDNVSHKKDTNASFYFENLRNRYEQEGM